MTLLTRHQQEALAYDRHISLTANAGSGKTLVLSKRFIEITLSTGTNLKNIAAITFTDKAASELYKKIALLIEEKISSEKDEKVSKKLERIRRQLVSANISTIHSFCIDILREHPVEAELDANFIPIDEILSTELIELSADEIIKEALKNNDESEKLKYLIRIFASKSKFENELISLIKNRKNVASVSEKIYTKNIEEIAGFFHNAFMEFSDKIFQRNKHIFIKALSEINNNVLLEKQDNQFAVQAGYYLNLLQREENHLSFHENIRKIKNLICTKDKNTRFLKKYLKAETAESVKKECKIVLNLLNENDNFILPANHAELESELADFGKKVIYFYEKTLQKYDEKKREQGYLDFEDILLHTKKVLTFHSVKEALSKKYKYLMVDEYQDTNELQYNIFLPILDYLKSGNLFIVGDEKQSIYMFRDAELEVFNRTKKDIEKIEGEKSKLQLPDSFRMAPALCLFTNYIFKNLFAEPDLLFNEVSHSDLVCARSDNEKGNIEILLAGESNSKNENESLRKEYPEAELTAKRIIKLIAENNINWGDITILCRKRKSFNELEKVFTDYKIPYLIVGGKGFYQQQSIYDIFNYFSFLLDKKNDTALIGILRSPFFTISDAQIYELSLLPGFTFWQKLLNSKDEHLKKARHILEKNLLQVHFYDLTAILRIILNETEYLSVLSSKNNSIQELANIDKLIKLTINFTSQGFKTLYDYVNFLSDSINKMEDEAQAAVAEESNAIKIMTLHQSKGLEFPIVFLYNCHSTAQKSALRSKEITVSKDFGILAKLPYKNNYFETPQAAPVININNLILKKKDLAELKRLFYVGITRAKNMLFISAADKENYSGESFMGLLYEGLKISPEDPLNNIRIKAQLKFLIKKNESYVNQVKELDIKIPVIKSIDEFIFPVNDEKKEPGEKILKHFQIKDFPGEEIISATKLSVYKQCPLKYQLTYEYGVTPLLKNLHNPDYPKKNYFEGNYKENDQLDEDKSNNSSHPEIKGRIIHKILQKELNKEQIKNFAESQIKLELNLLDNNLIQSGNLIREISADLYNYFESKIFNELKSFNNFFNEFEIYYKENDYYLYGIIDKLILTENKIIIVDYKTDDIYENEIDERAVSYLNQLKFYAYISGKLYKNVPEFELRLIFIKHPDKFIKIITSAEELMYIENEIKSMLYNVRNNIYTKNLNHCSRCTFSAEGSCIIK